MGRKDKQLSPALSQVYPGAGNQHDGSKSQGALAHQYRRKGQQYGGFQGQIIGKAYLVLEPPPGRRFFLWANFKQSE